MDSSTTESASRVGLGVPPGRLLQRAREAQNLSVPDVARHLKLSVHQVEFLEAGEFDKLPGPVFVRGFVRNYARLVKLDPEVLASSAADSLPRAEPAAPAPPSREIPFPTVAPRRWPRYAAVAIGALVVVLALYEFYWTEPDPLPDRSTAVAPAAPQVPARSAAENAPAPAATDVALRAAAESETGQPAASAAGEAAPAARAEAPAADGRAEARPGERLVRMVFEQDSWVEIRDRSGRAIFSRLNPRGTQQTVSGQPPLAVIVGNSHGVRLTYDDQPIDLAQYTKVDVARFNLE